MLWPFGFCNELDLRLKRSVTHLEEPLQSIAMLLHVTHHVESTPGMRLGLYL